MIANRRTETVIEAHLLAHAYVSVGRTGFDRERAIFPETVLAFIRETQPKEWARLEALHGGRPVSRSSVTCASGWTPTARWRHCATASSATGGHCMRPSSRQRTSSTRSWRHVTPRTAWG